MSIESLNTPDQELGDDKQPDLDVYAAYRSLERWLKYRYPTAEEIIARSIPDENQEILFVLLEDGTWVRPEDDSVSVDQSDDL